MKNALVLASLAQILGTATAHYNFPTIIYNNVTAKHWQYIRKWSAGNNYGNDDDFTPMYGPSVPVSFAPVNQMATLDIRCNVNATLAPETLAVKAGADLGFQAHTGQGGIGHPGPLLAYMAKVPQGKTAQNWDGDGNVVRNHILQSSRKCKADIESSQWFKISEDFPSSWVDDPINQGGTNLTSPEVYYTTAVWPTQEVHFKIPAAVPDGEYLFRVEHIALHTTYEGSNGPQFFVSCAQIKVIGGGKGQPGPLVAFPGAYNFSDPILLAARVWTPIIGHLDQPYVTRTPGPPVWQSIQLQAKRKPAKNAKTLLGGWEDKHKGGLREIVPSASQAHLEASSGILSSAATHLETNVEALVIVFDPIGSEFRNPVVQFIPFCRTAVAKDEDGCDGRRAKDEQVLKNVEDEGLVSLAPPPPQQFHPVNSAPLNVGYVNAMDWSHLTRDGLNSKCEELGLPKYGIKQDLITRLEEFQKKKPSAFGPQARNNQTPDRPRALSNVSRPNPFENTCVEDMSEAQLEEICRQNYVPYKDDFNGHERRAGIQAEFQVKYNEAVGKREDTIEKAKAKCTKDIEKARKERDDKLDNLEADVAPFIAKHQNWGPAFNKLKSLRAARGEQTHPNNYDPTRPRPTERPSFSLNNRLPSEQPPISSFASQSYRAVSPSARSTSAIATTSTATKRPASSLDFPTNDLTRPRLDTGHAIETEPILPQLTNNPFIFISDRNLGVRTNRIALIKTMIENKGFAPKHVRADRVGYYIVFEASVQGDIQAGKCCDEFQGRLFGGVALRLELKARLGLAG
ncbi:hypothetical protein G7Y89_g6143 [Cudoniella acicularis]|uniref:lytic cellulose monooxygenase (C4-dehydrogenating) n=1 Tax=Cudoniella acicularis TaxID=354080 RepID=A0A8H4RMT4_9HELO|nr:hypothetical protein G7Y89_g6143 [Cudoniella acicularis]